MTKHFLLPIVFFLVFVSCKKKEDDPAPAQPVAACESGKTGTVTVSNSSSNPYDVYIDDVFKIQIPGNTITTKITVSEGNNRKLYTKQVSGYLIYPTEKTTYFNALRCSDYSWQIP